MFCSQDLTAYRYRVGIVYLELCRLVISIGGSGGQQVEKHFQQVHVLPRHVGDLEDRTHPGRNTHTKKSICMEL